MARVSMKQLLESGVHFGHQTRRWNPKMKDYIFTERNGIYIIDLQKTLKLIDAAYNVVRDLISEGGSIIFVGTKKQAQETIRFESERCGVHFVSHRWLGGMLTNFKTIRKRIDRMIQLEKMETDGTFDSLTKKEVLNLKNEHEKLMKFIGGIRNMKSLPDAVYIVDPRKERIAVAEARKLDIPVIAIVDTNCDPDEIDHLIPGNDDAIRAVKLITSVLADAVLEGKQIIEASNEELSEDLDNETTDKAETELDVTDEAESLLAPDDQHSETKIEESDAEKAENEEPAAAEVEPVKKETSTANSDTPEIDVEESKNGSSSS